MDAISSLFESAIVSYENIAKARQAIHVNIEIGWLIQGTQIAAITLLIGSKYGKCGSALKLKTRQYLLSPIP